MLTDVYNIWHTVYWHNMQHKSYLTYLMSLHYLGKINDYFLAFSTLFSPVVCGRLWKEPFFMLVVTSSIYSKGPFPSLYPHVSTKNWMNSIRLNILNKYVKYYVKIPIHLREIEKNARGYFVDSTVIVVRNFRKFQNRNFLPKISLPTCNTVRTCVERTVEWVL